MHPHPQNLGGAHRFVAVLATVAVMVLGGALVSCSSDDGAGGDEVADRVIVDAEPTPETFDPTNPDQLEGVSLSPSELEAGDCFNEYIYQDLADFLQQITTVVSCDGPHDREAYLATEYPAEPDDPAPPEDTLRRWAEAACLEEFESFVGQEYVLSKLEIGAIVPTFESWVDDGDRSVICFVFPDEPDRRLRSSVRNSGL